MRPLPVLFATFLAGGIMQEALEAQEFQGVIMVQWLSGTAVAREVRNSHRGSLVRSEDLTPPMKGTWRVMDWSTGKGFIVIPAERTVSPLDMVAMKAIQDQVDAERRAAGQPPEAPLPVRATGQTETIAGHTCERVMVGERTEYCLAPWLGFPMPDAAAKAPFLGEPKNHPGSELIRGRTQLRIRTLQGDTWQTVWEVTSVERREVPALLFEVPPGYHPPRE